jgi:hypothetical protein
MFKVGGGEGGGAFGQIYLQEKGRLYWMKIFFKKCSKSSLFKALAYAYLSASFLSAVFNASHYFNIIRPQACEN